MDLAKTQQQWHPAFYSALKLELIENKDDLIYQDELTLNSAPIQLDFLVIKKNADVVIKNKIGNIFKGHNIVEYKSPNAVLDMDVLLKGIAYACLYKTRPNNTGEIRADDLTITFVRERKPVKLLKELESRGYKFEMSTDGIYVLRNFYLFDVQIIVGKELNQQEHVWIKSLSHHLERGEAEKLVTEITQKRTKYEKELADDVLQIAVHENEQIFRQLKEEMYMCEALRELMRPEIEEEMQEKFEQGIEQGMERGIKCGIERGMEQGVIKVVRNMKLNNMTVVLACELTGLTLKKTEIIYKLLEENEEITDEEIAKRLEEM